MVFDKVASIIADNFGVELEDITVESNFKEDFGIDSLELFTLYLTLDEEFDIELTDDRMNEIDCVGDVIRILKELGVED